MIRTKYLVVTVLVCIFTIMSAGFFSVVPHTIGIPKATAIFATPQDSYDIEKYGDNGKDKARREFIEKVRDSIAHDPVVAIQKAPSQTEEGEEEIISAPSPVVTPTSEPIHEVPVPVTPVVTEPTPTPETEPLATPTPPMDSETQTEEVPVAESPTI